jgi:hypothetical protein
MVATVAQSETDTAKIVFALKQSVDFINGLTGAVGTVLTGTGANVTPTFQSPATITPGLKFLASGTASSSASIDFTSLIDGTYDVYVFELNALLVQTNSVSLYARVSDDAGATWKATSYRWAALLTDDLPASTAVGSTSDVGVNIIGGAFASNVAANVITGTVKLYSPNTAGILKNIVSATQYLDTGSANFVCPTGGGQWTGGTGALNGMRFIPSSGNIVSGTIRMYGVSKS